jgi:YgiT-type zinc finger domain-containing protein
MTSQICDICGAAEAVIRNVTRSFGKGSDLLIIEDIPILSCPHCGESYMTAETMHEIERIKLHRAAISVPKPVRVAHFA